MSSSPSSHQHATWERYREVLRGRRLPAAIVDLDAFDRNTERLTALVRGAGKTLRLATKSVRVPGLIRRILEHAPEVYRGLMCYTPEEAHFLATGHGFDDLLVAYPSVQPSDMELLVELAQSGRTVAHMVDCRAHLEALNVAAARHGLTLEACLDIDMSLRLGPVHLGVRRSPLRTARHAQELARHARGLPQVRITGIMGYEAQVAGLPDHSAFSPRMDPVRRLVKRLSVPHAARLRRQVVQALEAEGVTLRFVNGGGTGSLNTTPSEDAVTEVTAGSGYLFSHLFEGYRHLPLEPAALFALQVVRSSDDGMATCAGGGYIASGPAGWDKAPLPWLPEGLELVPMEGAGEVQTPLSGPGAARLQPGEPVFFRHAKAGELAERFERYLLLRDGAIVGEEPTYRGCGKCFL